MQSIRRSLRLWVSLWLVSRWRRCRRSSRGTAARLTGRPPTPPSRAATRRPPPRQCPMRAADGTACPMHRGDHREADDTSTRRLRDARHLQRPDGGAGRATVEPRRAPGHAPGAPDAASRRSAPSAPTSNSSPVSPLPTLPLHARRRHLASAEGTRVPRGRVVSSHVEVSRAEFANSGACERIARMRRIRVVAQQSVDYASVSGRVTDPSGAVVPGAQVTARHTQTNLTATTVTDQRRPVPVPVSAGRAVRDRGASATDSSDATRPLTLTAGAAFELPVTLAVGSRRRQRHRDRRGDRARGGAQPDRRHGLPDRGPEPAAQRPQLPRARAARSRACRRPTSPARSCFPETSAVPGISLSVNSQRNLSNNFIVDGLSANDDAAALSGITYGVDAVEQLQVVTSGGQAELGRALGGYVNVVTKSGTNTLHGTVYDYVRDDRFNASQSAVGHQAADEPVAVRRQPRRPVVPNRTFYFANVEQRRLDQIGPHHHLAGQRRARQRAPVGGRLPGAAGRRPASTRIRWTRPTCSARSTTR